MYRRRAGLDTWHFVSLCRHWPVMPTLYLERVKKPKSGELCNECLAKARRRS